MTGSSRRRGNIAALLASGLAHAVVLLLLVRVVPRLSAPAVRLRPDFQVQLGSLQAGKGAGPAAPTRTRRAAVASPAAAFRRNTVAALATAPAAASNAATAARAPSPAPLPPAPATAAASAGSSGTGAAAGERDAVQRALRAALGCANKGLLALSDAEQAACRRRFVSGAAVNPGLSVDTIPSEKRAYYDAVKAAYAKVHASPSDAPAALGGAADIEHERQQAGFYIPMIACAVRFGIPRGWKSYHDRPPNSLKLGPLPCFIPPPQGPGFEESSVEAPASLRERTDDAERLKALDPPKP